MAANDFDYKKNPSAGDDQESFVDDQSLDHEMRQIIKELNEVSDRELSPAQGLHNPEAPLYGQIYPNQPGPGYSQQSYPPAQAPYPPGVPVQATYPIGGPGQAPYPPVPPAQGTYPPVSQTVQGAQPQAPLVQPQYQSPWPPPQPQLPPTQTQMPPPYPGSPQFAKGPGPDYSQSPYPQEQPLSAPPSSSHEPAGPDRTAPGPVFPTHQQGLPSLGSRPLAQTPILTARNPIPVPRPPVEPQSNTLLLTEKLDIGQDKVNEVIDLIDEIDDAGPKTFLGARDGTMVTDLTASELGQLIETAMGRALSKIFKK